LAPKRGKFTRRNYRRPRRINIISPVDFSVREVLYLYKRTKDTDKMNIYLDNCCYNRPYDGYTDDRSTTEVAAILAIIAICEFAGYKIFGSPAVVAEIDRIQNRKPLKWRQVREFYERTAKEYIAQSPAIEARARGFTTVGLGVYDAYHLAYAEAARADALLTTDDRFINTCARENLSIVNVTSPITFLPEVEEWAQ
jgi:predicted nucleic acid-binding protein